MLSVGFVLDVSRTQASQGGQHLDSRWFYFDVLCKWIMNFATIAVLVIVGLRPAWNFASGQEPSFDKPYRDTIADSLLQSYLSGLPEGMFLGRWDIRFGDRTNMENRTIFGFDESAVAGEWKLAPRHFEWFRAEPSPDNVREILRSDEMSVDFSSRLINGKVQKRGSFGEPSGETLDFHIDRFWWPNFLFAVSKDNIIWSLKRVENRHDRTFIHFEFGPKVGYFELDLRDGFQVLRIFEECKSPIHGDYSHDWTIENQSFIVDGRKFWFPRKARFFFHLRTAGQNKKKELFAEFSDVGYSPIAMKPKIEFPDGTEVHDRLQEIRYKVGGDSVTMPDIEEIKRMMARPDVEAPPDLRGRSLTSWLPRLAWWSALGIALFGGCAFGIYRVQRKSRKK